MNNKSKMALIAGLLLLSAAGASAATATTKSLTMYRSTLPSLPTYLPEDKLRCPDADRKVIGGYTIQCYTDYDDNDLDAVWAGNITECMAACAAYEGTPKCNAAIWRPAYSDGPCYLKSEGVNPRSDRGLMAFVKNPPPFIELKLATSHTSTTTSKAIDCV